MSDVVIDNHDFLGKLSVIKNCLSLLSEKEEDLKKKEFLKMASDTNQNLIDCVKAAKK